MMTELSLNVLDIAQNSVKAGASIIRIGVEAYSEFDIMILSIEDNGCGMDEDTLAKVTDPFSTSRTTRKVGLGVPFFKQAAEQSGGAFSIKSAPGKGTTVLASFSLSHIDRMPLGDMTATVLALVTANPHIDFIHTYSVNDRSFVFSTFDIREILGPDVPLNVPEVEAFIREFLTENKKEADGGLII